MARLDPAHLFEQADRLIVPLPAETDPRQTDLRHAVSTAYYGVFHFTVAAAVDVFVGSINRDSEQYRATYRTVTHAWLRALCDHVCGLLKPKFLPHVPGIDFFGPLVKLAANLVELQEARYSSDYDPSFEIKPDEARVWISMARDAITLFQGATERQQVTFMALLLFNLRK